MIHSRPTFVLFLFVLALIAFSGAVSRAVATAPAAQHASGQASHAEMTPVQRGAYLVRIMVCNDCHTPWHMGPNGPEPDMSRALSGHPTDVVISQPPSAPSSPWAWMGSETNTAFAGPWGVSFTANLTPDHETGLGAWTEEMFMTAIRAGRHQGKGRPILPPMPWPMFASATDDDLKAIFAYLRSLPPVRNRVPEPIEPAEPQDQ